MPRHPVALELLRQAGTPVAAPSANAFGKTSPTCAAHVREQLGPGDYTLIDGGGCRVGLESTVVSVTGETPVLLRPGGITREEIESVVGPIEVLASENHPVLKNAPLESPGLLASHYAPETPLHIKENLTGLNDDPRIGLILAAPDSYISKGPVVVLSETGNLEEAAARLYAALRKLDKMGLKEIWAPRFPDTGVGHALNDRLSKAAYKNAQ
jgi:L-threonylcarbamoyladenylate synthase